MLTEMLRRKLEQAHQQKGGPHVTSSRGKHVMKTLRCVCEAGRCELSVVRAGGFCVRSTAYSLPPGILLTKPLGREDMFPYYR